jgi:hypothetical protein
MPHHFLPVFDFRFYFLIGEGNCKKAIYIYKQKRTRGGRKQQNGNIVHGIKKFNIMEEERIVARAQTRSGTRSYFLEGDDFLFKRRVVAVLFLSYCSCCACFPQHTHIRRALTQRADNGSTFNISTN